MNRSTHATSTRGLAIGMACVAAICGADVGRASPDEDPWSSPGSRIDVGFRAGAGYKIPLEFHGRLGLLIGDIDPPGTRDRYVSAFLLELEPGTGGNKLGLGWTRGTRCGNSRWFPLVCTKAGGIAGTPKVVLVRTRGSPSPDRVLPGQTYLGFELEVSARLTNVTLGYLRRLGGDESSQKDVLTVGLGVAF